MAEALGIEATEDGEPRDEQAYLLLIEGRPLPTESVFEKIKYWS